MKHNGKNTIALRGELSRGDLRGGPLQLSGGTYSPGGGVFSRLISTLRAPTTIQRRRLQEMGSEFLGFRMTRLDYWVWSEFSTVNHEHTSVPHTQLYHMRGRSDYREAHAHTVELVYLPIHQPHSPLKPLKYILNSGMFVVGLCSWRMEADCVEHR